jgi:hypothetical protein
MAIRIFRSSGNTAPSSLAAGQLAYSEGTGGTALGGALFYGEIGGTVRNIGGKWLVDKVADIDTNFNANVDARIALANLDDLADVHVPTPSDGQTLSYSTANSRWEAVAPSTGVTTFIALNDTPVNFTGAGNFFVRVNSAANALEFVQDVDDGTF